MVESQGTGSGKKASLAGRVAIVTGGTVGIGRATCLALAREGACPVAVGRNAARLSETLEMIKTENPETEGLGLTLDVRSEADMAEMAHRTMERFGRIDILITAAGILRAQGRVLRTLRQMPAREWDEVLDTNLKGVFLANRAVLPTMIRQRQGDIVNLSSTSGLKGLAYDSAYCASKFGVIGLSQALAQEMQQYGVRVQLLLPGAIDTGMWDQNGPLPPPPDILSPEMVASLIIFLVTLPSDTVVSMPVIEPFKTRLRTGWLGLSNLEAARVAAEVGGRTRAS